ncbi:MAG TPA: hypothetical protein VF795_05045 [Desulfuromonadaceae bacterium]
MNRMVFALIAMLAMSTGARAENYLYGIPGLEMQNPGYTVFDSESIVNTVERSDTGAVPNDAFCSKADEEYAKHIGEINAIRFDKRLSIVSGRNASYSLSCKTYRSVIDKLKSADDIRRLWLLFADPVVIEKVGKDDGKNQDQRKKGEVELRRLEAVSKYIEFFTKNKGWKLTDYTFLSQAFKARKDKPLSPAYAGFLSSLLTGDTEMALRIVKSIDMDNIGNTFIVPAAAEKGTK